MRVVRLHVLTSRGQCCPRAGQNTLFLCVFCVSVEWHLEGRLETVPPVTTEQVDHILIGRMKGIQGHCNSCYMDAALFRSGAFRGWIFTQIPKESRQPFKL